MTAAGTEGSGGPQEGGEPVTPALNLSADDYLELTNAHATVTRLVLLDGFWTRQARSASSEAGDPALGAAVKPVVDEMDRTLVELRDVASRLPAIFTRYGPEMQTRYAELLEGRTVERADGRRVGLTEDQRTRIRKIVDERSGGDIVAHAINASERIAAHADTEREHLRQEFERIASGRESAGDLDVGFTVDILCMEFGIHITVPDVIVEAVSGLLGLLGL